MPTLNPASIVQEYIFNEEELKLAQVLSPLQVQYYHTLRAQMYVQRNTTPVPENSELDRAYLMRIAELDGRIAFIQQMFDDHEKAVKGIKESEVTPINVAESSGVNLNERASNLVHKQS